jgi:hypothetical protein
MDFGGMATFDLKAENPDTFFVDDSLMYMNVEWKNGAVARLMIHFSEGEPPTVLEPVAE